MSETTFKFYKNPYIWKFLNRQLILDNPNDIFMEAMGEGDYTFVLCESVPTNPVDCIDSNTGCLIETLDGLSILDLSDVYTDLDIDMPYFKLKRTYLDNGGGFTLELDSGDDSSVQIQVGDAQNIYLQGIFLCKREASETGDKNFVVAYATIHSPINVRNFINVPYNGMVLGVGYCGRNLSNTNLDELYYTV